MEKFQVWYGEQIVETIEAENEEEARKLMSELTILSEKDFKD